MLAAVLRIFDELLGGPTQAQDDFFSLGGTSLVAARLVTELTSASGRQIRMVDVLRLRTPAMISGHLQASPALADAQLPTAARAAQWELSPPQRWYSRVYSDTLAGAVMSFALPLPDGVAPESVWTALGELVERHDSLRTSVVRRDARLVQTSWVAEDGPASRCPSWGRSIDVAGDVEAVAAEAAHVCAQGEAEGIPVDGGPLLRVVMVRGSEPKSDAPVHLAVIVHHLIFDGASISILERELYARLTDAQPPLPPATSYRDYTSWRLSRETPASRQSEQAWWTRRLAGTDGSCQLRLRDNEGEAAGYVSEVTLPSALRGGVAAAARREAVPVSALRTAAFFVVCHVLYDNNQMLIGMPVEVREHPALRRAIGMFVNHALVRHRLKDRETVRELVQDVAKELLSVAQARDRPFDVAMDVAPERCVSGRFPISGAVINAVDAAAPDALPIEQVRTGGLSRARISDLQLNFVDTPSQVDVQVRHRSDTLSAEEGARLLACYLDVLHTMTRPGPTSVESLLERAREVLGNNSSDEARIHR